MSTGSNRGSVPKGWRPWTVEDELRHELDQALGTIEFLHGCLTEPDLFKYAYPEMTLEKVERWKELAKGAPECTARFSSTHPKGICPVHHRLMPV